MDQRHALLIDDDAEALHIMEQALKQLQISSTSVNDPRNLETLLTQIQPITIIFLDLEMPKLDGYEVLAALKKYINPQVPIIACSVHTSELHNTRRSGFSSFIAKPLDIDRFPELINRILNGQAVWESR